MSYPVAIADRAFHELDDACTWWAENRSEQQSLRWYNGFIKAIRSLAEDPERCPLAPENHAFPYEVRQIVYGLGKRPTHRAVFTIVPIWCSYCASGIWLSRRYRPTIRKGHVAGRACDQVHRQEEMVRVVCQRPTVTGQRILKNCLLRALAPVNLAVRCTSVVSQSPFARKKGA